MDPGTVFAGYRVESLVARGGMGVVYRAVDLKLERPVALKLIAPELAADERFRVRFLRESRLAASLDHPNVVPIYEAGEHDGQLYLAMRFVEGSDLKTLLPRHGALDPERTLPILAQVAHALDAAHRRALVHRDVKPGNVLIDDDGHAYLTDFGVTKRVGGDTTDTGHMVGTLDYLAPEQIRGEPIDGRTDQYALACVLYECLAGLPPFRRETEGEALWAHMQDDFAPLREYPRLSPVLAKGLAKERDARHGTCAELIDDATRALGLAPRAVRRRRAPPILVRHRRAILAAGVAIVAATATATVLVMTRDTDAEPPVGSGVVAIGLDGDRAGPLIEAETAPSNIAVGEGAVWVLNTEDKTISRIDPKTKTVVETFETGHRPVDLAAGAGALWVGNSDERFRTTKVSISRIDPETRRTTHTVKVPDDPYRGGWESSGHPMIAVGAGGVWTGNREGTISRLDPKTGKVLATLDDTFARRIAAGREGVWVVGGAGNDLWGIDPRSNKATEHVTLGAYALYSIAVGAGSVWAVSAEGTLWRVDPQPPHVTQAITVGVGTEFVAYGEGQIWTGNFVDGTISRIDPRTNAVAATIPVGASQSLAAGEGSAWVSVASGTRDGVLPASTCTAVEAGGREPDVLIVSDLPLQGAAGGERRAMADAIRFVLKDHGHRAGAFTVGYRSCDNSTAQSGDTERRKCAANANAYAWAANVVAMIGPYYSYCAQIEIPILNRAPGGPLAMISSSNGFSSLTRGGRLALPPPIGVRGEPEAYYPTGQRNYTRVNARDDIEGAAAAMLAKRLGLASVYLLYSDFEAGDVAWTKPFARAAAHFDIAIAGSRAYDDEADFRALASTIARSGADGVFVGGGLDRNEQLLKSLRARLGKDATIMGAGPFSDIPFLIKTSGRAARGTYVATAGLPDDGPGLTPAARSFARRFGTSEVFALQTAQATEVVLQAIGRSAGTRASVLRELHATRIRNGLLGSFGFDRHGDMTPGRVAILKVTGTTPANLDLPDLYEGAIVDSVVTVPPELSG